MIPVKRIESAILELRGERVMLDADLAAVYGVATKTLVRAVNRNLERFPAGFMLQLNAEEFANLRCQFGTSSWGGRRYPPYAFTEHGAVMLAAVLKSKRAVEVSVFVVKAFIRMRRMLADQRQFALKLAEIENKLVAHDQSIKVVFDAIRQLMQKPEPETEKRRKIGFQVREPMAKYEARARRRKKP
jgi:phage regulator Rha-like protein